jgi:hypothetical protein
MRSLTMLSLTILAIFYVACGKKGNTTAVTPTVDSVNKADTVRQLPVTGLPANTYVGYYIDTDENAGPNINTEFSFNVIYPNASQIVFSNIGIIQILYGQTVQISDTFPINSTGVYVINPVRSSNFESITYYQTAPDVYKIVKDSLYFNWSYDYEPSCCDDFHNCGFAGAMVKFIRH